MSFEKPIGKTEEVHYFLCVLCTKPFSARGVLWHFSSQTEKFEPPNNTCPRCGTPCEEISRDRYRAIKVLS